MNQFGSQPRYDLTRNPPYQVNFCAKKSGKHINVTKRRITFQFGFSSADAIATGRKGMECRGEEHEVVLLWSHITGKRQIFMDGNEIHASKANGYLGSSKFQHSWSIPGNHLMQLVVYGKGSEYGEPEEWKQKNPEFDLLVDGCSFFRFVKIHELGGAVHHGNPFELYDQYNSISYNGARYVGEDRSDEEYEDEVYQPSASLPFPDENMAQNSTSNQNRLSLVMKSVNSKIEKSKSSLGIGASHDSPAMPYYGGTSNEGRYSQYGDSPITVFDTPDRIRTIPSDKDLDMPFVEDNNDAPLYGDFMQTQQAGHKSQQKTSKIPTLRKPSFNSPSFTRSKSLGLVSKNEVDPWGIVDNQGLPETAPNTNQKKSLFSTMSPIKMKSFRRAESLPINTSDNDYFDPSETLNRSPSKMSFEYELMKDSKSFMDVRATHY